MFPIEGYDEMNVEEVSKRLDDLSVEELQLVRDYEELNKKRETLLEQMDRKIRSAERSHTPIGKRGRVVCPGPSSCPYSAECVEGGFSEVHYKCSKNTPLGDCFTLVYRHTLPLRRTRR